MRGGEIPYDGWRPAEHGFTLKGGGGGEGFLPKNCLRAF